MTHPPESRRYSDPALFPERLGRYEVLLPIASGGMATVYLARAVGAGGFERDVALKLTHFHLREDPDFVASLVDEARLAGQIRHPNVVSVLDVGEDPHGVFIVMEYVEGDSLAAVQRLLRKSGARMPLPVTLRLLDDLLLGLHAAHELRDEAGEPLWLVHRDVTPHNVLLGIDGVAKLTDFGIAKAASRLGNTATGLVKGKIAYMAPEQAQGHSIDRRVDVWAAGVLAWEAFSGTRLYDGSNDAAILLKIVREVPMRLRAIAPDVPQAIDDVVAKALSLGVADRHPTAEAFAEALAAAASASGVARAERREVSQFLTPLLGERLAQRRDKAREVRALRQRMGELAALDPGMRPSTPPPRSSPRASSPAPSADATVLATATVESGPPTATITEADGAMAASDQTQTGTAGISTMARSILPPRRQRLLVVAGVAGGALLALGLGVALLGGDEDAVSPAATPASPPASPPAARPEPPPVTNPAEPAPSQAAAGPAASEKPTSPKAKPPRVPRVGGASTAQKPLGNPYKKP